MEYIVKSRKEEFVADACWDKKFWQNIPAVTLNNYMGDKPAHFPQVQAKICYDSENLYVIFRVEDRYVRAVAEKHEDIVCWDSCVEFFFCPQSRTDQGYFNLETNCGGTMLFHYQTGRGENTQIVSDQHRDQIEMATTLPRIVEPEITTPTTWMIEYRLPVNILSGYTAVVDQPAPGVKWRANFYKCGDKTSHRHHLTWALVEKDRPDFHLPKFFGTIIFE
ncbi:MAG: carbohydrate-binding family 9-like protein [Sedimentisphaerales bacterium]|nr:carbohydrate-binding family 9-like protein [Sedimentisphaerales bacterium]